MKFQTFGMLLLLSVPCVSAARVRMAVDKDVFVPGPVMVGGRHGAEIAREGYKTNDPQKGKYYIVHIIPDEPLEMPAWDRHAAKPPFGVPGTAGGGLKTATQIVFCAAGALQVLADSVSSIVMSPSSNLLQVSENSTSPYVASDVEPTALELMNAVYRARSVTTELAKIKTQLQEVTKLHSQGGPSLVREEDAVNLIEQINSLMAKGNEINDEAAAKLQQSVPEPLQVESELEEHGEYDPDIGHSRLRKYLMEHSRAPATSWYADC